MVRIAVGGEVFEPKSISNSNEGEARGNDDEALVDKGGAMWCLVLVCSAPLKNPFVKAEIKEGLIRVNCSVY